MASYSYTFTSGDSVTPTKLNNARTVSDIVNADISATAAIVGTKIDPNFGSQNAVTTGTVTAAKLIPTGTSATGNGVYLPAANTVAVSTDGTERMRVAATGEVCVNTTTTDGYLNVGSGSGQFPNGIVIKPTSHATSRRAGAFLDDWGLLQDTVGSGTKDFGIYQAASSALRVVIKTDGKVGIGTASPGYLLDVTGIVNTSSNFAVDGTQVVGSRRTGWAAATGTATRTTFATSTVTTAQLAERVKALIDDLRTHGLLGN